MMKKEWVDILRLLLALMVVCEHALLPTDSYLFNLFVRGFSVPVFFYLSGLLYYRNFNTLSDYRIKIVHRLRTLLLPYLLWNVMILVPLLVVNCVKNGLYVQQLTSFLSGFLFYDGLLSGHNLAGNYFPANVPLWYLRDLMVIVCACPLLSILMKRVHVVLPLASLLLWLLFFSNWYGCFFMGVFFFYLGSIDVERFVRLVPQYGFILLFLLFAGCSWAGIDYYFPVPFACLFFLLLSAKVAMLLSDQGVGSKIAAFSGFSAFLYCSHYLLVRRLFYFFFMSLPVGISTVFAGLADAVLVTVLLWIVYVCLSRRYPRLVKLLIGKS